MTGKAQAPKRKPTSSAGFERYRQKMNQRYRRFHELDHVHGLEGFCFFNEKTGIAILTKTGKSWQFEFDPYTPQDMVADFIEDKFNNIGSFFDCRVSSGVFSWVVNG